MSGRDTDKDTDAKAPKLSIEHRHRSYDEVVDTDEITNDVFLEEDERMTPEDIERLENLEQLERRSRGTAA